MDKFVWSVTGLDGNGNRWETEGVTEASDTATFHSLVDVILQSSFYQLTQGLAVYGRPGVGCVGPYKTHTLDIRKVIDANV